MLRMQALPRQPLEGCRRRCRLQLCTPRLRARHAPCRGAPCRSWRTRLAGTQVAVALQAAAARAEKRLLLHRSCRKVSIARSVSLHLFTRDFSRVSPSRRGWLTHL